MDHSLPDAGVEALSRFCRLAPEKIHALDLRLRAPYLNPTLLLCFQNASQLCPRCCPSFAIRFAGCVYPTSE